jgi:mannitol/fructose-specific phosphotransferase system IIA component (Ntr-type)
MKLGDVLDERLVRVPLQAQTRIGAIKELIDALAAVHAIPDTLDLLQSILRQDDQHACRIDGGEDAEPPAIFVHARSASCPLSFVGVGIAPKNRPVVTDREEAFRILVLMIAPHGDVSGYVWVQGKLLRVLRRAGVRRALAGAANAAEVVRILTDREEEGADRDGVQTYILKAGPRARSGKEASCNPPC